MVSGGSRLASTCTSGYRPVRSSSVRPHRPTRPRSIDASARTPSQATSKAYSAESKGAAAVIGSIGRSRSGSTRSKGRSSSTVCERDGILAGMYYDVLGRAPSGRRRFGSHLHPRGFRRGRPGGRLLPLLGRLDRRLQGSHQVHHPWLLGGGWRHDLEPLHLLVDDLLEGGLVVVGVAFRLEAIGQ